MNRIESGYAGRFSEISRYMWQRVSILHYVGERKGGEKSVKLNGTILESAQCVWCETAEEEKKRVKKIPPI